MGFTSFVGRQNVNGQSDVWWDKQFAGQQRSTGTPPGGFLVQVRGKRRKSTAVWVTEMSLGGSSQTSSDSNRIPLNKSPSLGS